LISNTTRIVGLLLVLSCACMSVSCADSDYEFGEKLREYKLYDLALKVFKDLEKKKGVSKEQKLEALLGRANILQDRARLLSPKTHAEEKSKLLEKSREIYEQFIDKAKSTHPKLADAVLKVALFKKDQANALVKQAEAITDKEKASEKATLHKQAGKLFKESIEDLDKIVKKSDETIEKIEAKYNKKKPRGEDEKTYLQAKSHHAQASLYGAQTLFDYAAILKDKEKEETLNKCVDAVESYTFYKDGHPDCGYAWFIQARAERALGKLDRAFETLKRMITFNSRNRLAVKIYKKKEYAIRAYYFRVLWALEEGKLDKAVEFGKEYENANPFTARKTKIGVAVLVQYAKALFLTKEAANQHEAIEILWKTIEIGDAGVYEALKAMQEILKDNEDYPPNVYTCFSLARAARIDKDDDAALTYFLQAASLMNAKQRLKLGDKLLYQMGSTHYAGKNYLEAAMCFTGLCENYPKSKHWEKAKKLEASMWYKSYSIAKSQVALVRYQTALTRTKDGKPAEEEAKDKNVKLGKLKMMRKLYDQAIEHFKEVEETSENYELSLFLTGECQLQLTYKFKAQPEKAKKARADAQAAYQKYLKYTQEHPLTAENSTESKRNGRKRTSGTVYMRLASLALASGQYADSLKNLLLWEKDFGSTATEKDKEKATYIRFKAYANSEPEKAEEMLKILLTKYTNGIYTKACVSQMAQVYSGLARKQKHNIDHRGQL
jgi:hypothetical protein